MDLKKERVTNEFVFQRQDGGNTEKFFSAPVPSDLDDDERNLWILMRFHFKKNGR